MEDYAPKPNEPAFRAGYGFVGSMLVRKDGESGPYPWWHGWALRQGFWEGIKWQRELGETQETGTTDSRPIEDIAIVRFLEREDILVRHITGERFGQTVYHKGRGFQGHGKNVIIAARMAMEREREYLAEKQKGKDHDDNSENE